MKSADFSHFKLLIWAYFGLFLISSKLCHCLVSRFLSKPKPFLKRLIKKSKPATQIRVIANQIAQTASKTSKYANQLTVYLPENSLKKASNLAYSSG